MGEITQLQLVDTRKQDGQLNLEAMIGLDYTWQLADSMNRKHELNDFKWQQGKHISKDAFML